MPLAENIRYYREKQKLTQKSLADLMGVSYPRISELENDVGNPTVSTIYEIAEALGVEAWKLLKPRRK